MGQAIGSGLPFAIGVAISPIPIIAVIAMLLSRRAATNSLAFVVGWIAGATLVTVATIVLADVVGTTTNGQTSKGVGGTHLVLGIVLVLLAFRQWRKRPAPGEQPEGPKWLQAIDSMSAPKSFGVAVLLVAVNPKNLLLLVGGALSIATAASTTGQRVTAAVVLVALASATVLLPVVAYRVLGARADPTLRSWREWLALHNSAVMSVLLLVFGVVLIGKAVGIL